MMAGMDALVTSMSAVAAETPDPNEIGPGLLAFGIVALLALASFLLFRSMNNQIRKVPPTFDPPEQPDDQPDQPPQSTDDGQNEPRVS